MGCGRNGAIGDVSNGVRHAEPVPAVERIGSAGAGATRSGVVPRQCDLSGNCGMGTATVLITKWRTGVGGTSGAQTSNACVDFCRRCNSYGNAALHNLEEIGRESTRQR